MSHQIILNTGVVHCRRCIMCGYMEQTLPQKVEQQFYNPKIVDRPCKSIHHLRSSDS